MTQLRRRVLIVDDDADVRRALGTLLGRYHDVVLAASGADALTIVGSEGPFDAVLCDLMMPAMDGVAVYETLRRESPDVCARFAFVTGGALTQRTNALVASGEVIILEKPSRSANLLRVIGELASRPRR